MSKFEDRVNAAAGLEMTDRDKAPGEAGSRDRQEICISRRMRFVKFG
jgi:hypothetical protein